MFFIRGYVHIRASSRFYSFHPLFQHDFARKKRRNGLTGVFRFALHCSLPWTGQSLSVTDAIHPLILMTEQRKDFIMYRLHIQDRHHLRALVLSHLPSPAPHATCGRSTNPWAFMLWQQPPRHRSLSGVDPHQRSYRFRQPDRYNRVGE